MAMFLNLLNRWESAELIQAKAAELLGVSERTFRRWRDRYDEDGAAGLIDRRLGKASGRRVPVDRAEEVERLYRERYQGFTVKHFHEHLVKDHGFGWGYTWLKLHLQWMVVVARAPRKGAHRRKRERRPLPGMMLHQDGSRHAWLEGEPALDLIVTLDDATGAIYSAFLVEEEGTASTFRALKEVFSQHGLPMSLYADRGSHYFRTTKAGEIDRGCPTQVGRALAQLGVEPIGAFSPQTRGRSERAFGTLQDRLVKELRLAGITEVEAANAFIRDVYRPAHNARFAVEPAGESSAFTPIPGVDLDEILCVEEERQVGNDNCVSYRTLKLQIPGARCVPISSGRGSRSTSIPAVPTPSFTDHDASAATTRTAGSRTPSQSNAPLNSARRRACGNGDNAAALPPVPQGNKPEEADKPRATKTGQLHSLST
jgi:Winged helix-turn helix